MKATDTIRKRLGRLAVPAAMAAAAVTLALPVAAQDFKGRTIRLIVDFKPGGGTDIQARYFASNWSKFLPGNPRIRVSNIFPNPAGRNFVWKSKPDGLTLDFVASPSVGREFIDPNARFETEKFVQIGSHAKRDVVLLVRGTVPYKSLKDAKGGNVPIVLAEPIAAPTDLDGKLLAVGMLSMWLDAPLKIATVARSGTADTLLMLERGDVNAYLAGSQWYALPKLRPGWFKDGYLKPIADLGHPDTPSIPNSEISMTVPNAYTWLTPEQKELWEGIVLPEVISGKGVIAPPGTPADITKALREAYEAAVKDPEFAKGLEKIQGQPIAFISGVKMQELVAKANKAFKKELPNLKQVRQQVYNRYFKDAAPPTIPERISGKITKVSSGGRGIVINGHAVRVTSSRTTITLGGAPAKRDELKAGLSCELTGAMRKGRYEARKMACK